MAYLPPFQYLPPDMSDHCQCKGNPMKAMFCMAGHMLECHYPMNCRTAGCSHLTKYDYTIEEADELRELAHPNLLKMADEKCERCSGSGVMKVKTNLARLYAEQSPYSDLEGEFEALCTCVTEHLIAAIAGAYTKFQLGVVQATTGVMEKWKAQGKDPNEESFQYLSRHVIGDWGDLDTDDKALNDLAIQQGDRILSRYEIEPDFTIYIITEANRSLTTILLTYEY